MKFEPQNDLERSLVKAARDPSQVVQFYRDLLKSKLYVVRPASASEDAGPKAKVRVLHVKHKGKPHVAIFSSLQRLQPVLKSESAYVGMNAVKLLRQTQGKPLVLNPGSGYGKEITVEEAARIVDGTILKSH